MRHFFGALLSVFFCFMLSSSFAADRTAPPAEKKAPAATGAKPADARNVASPAPVVATSPVIAEPQTSGADPQTSGPSKVKPEEETYSYESSTRRDPFYSLISAAKLAEKKKRRTGSPLEEYDLNEIKLVAIVADASKDLNKYALVKLPSGKHYTLKEGTPIGVRSGKIVKISPDAIVIQEVATDFRGRQYPKVVTLKLREQEE